MIACSDAMMGYSIYHESRSGWPGIDTYPPCRLYLHITNFKVVSICYIYSSCHRFHKSCDMVWICNAANGVPRIRPNNHKSSLTLSTSKLIFSVMTNYIRVLADIMFQEPANFTILSLRDFL